MLLNSTYRSHQLFLKIDFSFTYTFSVCNAAFYYLSLQKYTWYVRSNLIKVWKTVAGPCMLDRLRSLLFFLSSSFRFSTFHLTIDSTSVIAETISELFWRALFSMSKTVDKKRLNNISMPNSESKGPIEIWIKSYPSAPFPLKEQEHAMQAGRFRPH